MNRFSTTLLILAVIIVSFGFYRGWFTLSSNRETQNNQVDVNLKIDQGKMQQDATTVKEEAKKLTGPGK